MSLLLRWLASAAAVAVAAAFVPGIRMDRDPVALLIVAAVLGLVNAFVRPILRWLSCGVIVLTLGLFLLVINAVMLILAAWISRQLGVSFFVDGFAPALIGSVVISLVSYLLSLLLPGDSRDD